MTLSASPRTTAYCALGSNMQLGLQLLIAPRLELQKRLQEIMNHNPFLRFTDPAQRGPDEWGFFERKPDDESPDWNEFIGAEDEPDLSAQISAQLSDLALDPFRDRIARAWFSRLDEHGRACASPVGIALLAGCSVGQAETILALLQTFEPRGVFARDIFECFRLQLAGRPDVQSFVTTHLPHIMSRSLITYARASNISIARLKEYLEILKPLKRTFLVGDRTPVPDAELKVTFPTGREPLVEWLTGFGVTTQYREQRHEMPQGVELWTEADAIRRMVMQREDTLLRVTTAIAEAQRDYLYSLNPLDFKPLSQIDIANVSYVNLHHTTVGRAVMNKSIICHNIEIHLSDLFSTRIGEKHSTIAVEQLLKDLIHEAPRLTDEGVRFHIMKRHGIDIARRTVAEYRKRLGLLKKSNR